MTAPTPNAPAQPAQIPILGFVLLVTLWLVWGSSWPAMRMVFLEIPVWQFRAVTGIIGGIALLLLAQTRASDWLPPRRVWGALVAAAFFNMTIWHVCVGYGLQFMGSGHAAIIVYTMPVWTAVLSPFFLSEAMTVRKFVALALGMAGVLVLLASDFEALGTSPVGMIFLITAAVGWAVGTIVVKRTEWPIGMYALAGWQLIIGVIPIAVIAVATEEFTMHEASERAIWAALYVTFFAIIAGYALWFSIVRIMPATVASIGALVIPVIGVFAGAIMLAEPLTWREFVAMGLVLTAVALVVFQRRRAA